VKREASDWGEGLLSRRESTRGMMSQFHDDNC
jgi:hypothetical protein